MKKKINLFTLILGSASVVFSLGLIVTMSLVATGDVKLLKDKFQVRFLNYDFSELYETEVIEGHNAVYEGKTPTKPSDGEFNYYFAGWDKDLNYVTSSFRTIALFTSEAIGNSESGGDDSETGGQPSDGGNEDIGSSEGSGFEGSGSDGIGDGDGGEGGGGAGGGLEPSKGRLLMNVTTDQEGLVYMRETSFGNYKGTSWRQAPLFDMSKLGTGEINPIDYTAQIGSRVFETYDTTVEYISEFSCFPVPQYNADFKIRSRNDSCNIDYFVDDIYHTQHVALDYDEVTLSMLRSEPLSENEIRQRDNYYNYAMNNYTYVNNAYFTRCLDFINKYKLNANDPDLFPKLVDSLDEYRFYNPKSASYPNNVDPLINFFDGHTAGDSNMFASWATLIFRTLGFPARYVKGYFNLNFFPGDVLPFTTLNDHRWVEVYLKDIGWLSLEVCPVFGDKNPPLPDDGTSSEDEGSEGSSESSDSSSSEDYSESSSSEEQSSSEDSFDSESEGSDNFGSGEGSGGGAGGSGGGAGGSGGSGDIPGGSGGSGSGSGEGSGSGDSGSSSEKPGGSNGTGEFGTIEMNAENAVKYYDGLPFVPNISYDPSSLRPGDYIIFDYKNMDKCLNVGTYNLMFDYKIYDSTGEDVTLKYKVIYPSVHLSLKIKPRPIEITTASFEANLNYESPVINGLGERAEKIRSLLSKDTPALALGQTFVPKYFYESFTETGLYQNRLKLEECKILDSNGVNQIKNYQILLVTGEVVITLY